MREALKSQAYILSGSGSRMISALGYFLILINTLSLEDYGIFVALVAAGLMIGNTGTYGFLAPTFRAHTEKAKSMGAFTGALIIYGLLWLPISLAGALLVHFLFFADYASLTVTLIIVSGEALFIRLVDVSYNINIARGRYAIAALINLVLGLSRLGAVGVFYLVAEYSLEVWVWYHLWGYVACAGASLLLFPPTQVRLSIPAFRQGFREALALEGANFVQSVQMELDKVLVLAFAGPVAAGIYGLSMRIIYVVSEPIRAMFPLVAKFFIGNPDELFSRNKQLLFEGGLILSALAAYGVLVMLLYQWPNLLGQNVAAGYAFFATLPAVFALKLLPEYHKTVLYGAKKLHLALVIAISLALTKSVLLTVIASQLPFHEHWALPMNMLFAILYLQSLLLTWRWAMPGGRNTPASPVVASG